MKLLLSIVSLISLSMMSCGNVSNKMFDSCDNCEQFRNGKFKLTLKTKTEDIHFLIERNDSIQTETVVNTGQVAKLRIKWTSPCSYECLLLETWPAEDAETMSKRKTVQLQTNIISCSEDYYVFESKKIDNKTFGDTIWVIE